MLSIYSEVSSTVDAGTCWIIQHKCSTRTFIVNTFNEKSFVQKISLNHENSQLACNRIGFLTLKVPITTAADDKICDIFPNFRKK